MKIMKRLKINPNLIDIKKHRKQIIIKIFVLFAVLLLLSSNQVFAMWIKINSPQNKESTISRPIGSWIFGIVNYDPNNKRTIQAGTFVLRTNSAGVPTLYYCINTVSETDPNNDPLIPNTNSNNTMKYVECTNEYRAFHRYDRDDFVYYNNMAYYYNSNRAHIPNTATVGGPGVKKEWKDRKNVSATEVFYRYQAYYRNDEVIHDNNRYRCIVDITCNSIPGTTAGNAHWQRI